MNSGWVFVWICFFFFPRTGGSCHVPTTTATTSAREKRYTPNTSSDGEDENSGQDTSLGLGIPSGSNGNSHTDVTATSEARLPPRTSTRGDADDALCAVCATKSLESLTPYPPSQHHKPVPFTDIERPLSEFQANRRCPLCRLIVSIACADHKVIEIPGTSVIILQDITSFALSQDGMDIRIVSTLQGHIIEGDGGRVVDIGIRQIAQPNNLAAHEWEGVLLGRPVHDQIDFQLISNWLKLCNGGHGYERHVTRVGYEGFSLARPATIPFVIDTTKCYVTPLPSGSEYATLSYVWGPACVKQLKWTRETYRRLHSPGRLGTAKNDVPATVRDAMTLCARLGIRYLWVEDALCIPQDDAHLQARYISEMANIYHHSHLTIVAASGETSHAGLPGLRPGTRRITQHKETVLGTTLASTCPDLDTVLSTCPWHRRAWTLQEALFSRRLLVFSDHQCFFHCPNGVLYEDLNFEINNPAGARHRNNADLGLYMLADWRQDSYGEGAMPFRDVVKKMHSRALTNPGDVLRAFAGVSRYFSSQYGWTFWYGIPVERFDQCMLFGPAASSRQRKRISDVELDWVGNGGRRCRHTRALCLLRLSACYVRGALATVRQEKGRRMGVLHPWPSTHPDMGGWDSGRRVHCRQPHLPILRVPSVDDPTIAVETKKC